MTIRIARHTVIPDIMQVRVRAPQAAAAAGWWVVAGKTCVAAYQPKGAASYAASLTDLSGSGNHATEGTPPSWASATGWAFVWPTKKQYLQTGVVPTGAYSMFIRFTNATLGDCFIGGGIGAGDTRFAIDIRYGTSSIRYFYGNAAPNVAPIISAGVVGLAGPTGYRNGVAEGNPLGTFTGTGVAIYIGAYNNNGTATGAQGPGKIQAAAIYSGTLSAPEAATLSAAMAAL